jgi:hypothetical protein
MAEEQKYHNSSFTGTEVEERLQWSEDIHNLLYAEDTEEGQFLIFKEGAPQWVTILRAEDEELFRDYIEDIPDDEAEDEV